MALVHPWGTGHYERSDGGFKFGLWWNSGGAKAYMKIDTAEQYAGRQSLRITNFSPAKPHVFTTLSQRISLLKPNAVYRISFLVKTPDLTPGAVDPGRRYLYRGRGLDKKAVNPESRHL